MSTFKIKQKKYEVIEKHCVFSGMMSIMSVANMDTNTPDVMDLQQVRTTIYLFPFSTVNRVKTNAWTQQQKQKQN